MKRVARLLVLGALLAPVASGCAPERTRPSTMNLARPAVTGLSTGELAVGDDLIVSGRNFPTSDDGWVDFTMQGDFITTEGDIVPVDLTVPLEAIDASTLRWNGFGAYRIPFGDGMHAGRFEGVVFATTRYYDGSAIDPDTADMMAANIAIQPSIVVRDFRAMGGDWFADCAEPTNNAIQGLVYGMRVRAVGFEAVHTEFVLSEGFIVDGEPTSSATRVVSDLGGDEQAVYVQPAMLPTYVNGFTASIDVRMTDAYGNVHELQFPIVVRRPLQVFYTTRMEIAEILEPQPVSGCIPGGPGGVGVEYSESRSETRTRTTQRTLQRGWTSTLGEQHAATYGSALTNGSTDTEGTMTSVTDGTTMGGSTTDTDAFSRTDGRQATTGIDFSTTDSSTSNWSIGQSMGQTQSASLSDSQFGSDEVRVGAEVGTGSITGTIVSGKVTGGWSGTTGWNRQQERGLGTSQSVDTNRGGSSGTSTSMGGSQSVSSSSQLSESQSRAIGTQWGRSSTYAEANSFSRARSVSSTASYSSALTQSASIAQNLGDSETEIYSVSTTESTALRISGQVWAGQFGMWYRQPTRLARRGVVVAYDLCGNASAVGDVVVDDWTWAPDLAIGPTCPPPTQLPLAECRIAPCDN